MSESDTGFRITRDGWASAVASVLAAHPDWIDITVEAMQAGVVEAIERQKDRSMTLSLGLYESLNSRPGAKKRNHQRIIDAVRQTQFAGSPWADRMIAREQQGDSSSESGQPEQHNDLLVGDRHLSPVPPQARPDVQAAVDRPDDQSQPAEG